MPYKYRIVRTEMGWIISRKKEIGGLMLLQYFNSHWTWTPNIWAARVFYREADAGWALSVIKRKDEWKKSD